MCFRNNSNRSAPTRYIEQKKNEIVKNERRSRTSLCLSKKKRKKKWQNNVVQFKFVPKPYPSRTQPYPIFFPKKFFCWVRTQAYSGIPNAYLYPERTGYRYFLQKHVPMLHGYQVSIHFILAVTKGLVHKCNLISKLNNF